MIARAFGGRPPERWFTIDDVTRIAVAIRLELQEHDASPEDLIRVMNCVIDAFICDPEMSPDKRPSMIVALAAGFGYAAEPLLDGTWRLTRQSVH